ncbi:MAG: alkaline phosphatase family protein [Deltaproteobacteria bacterium]|nr:alkaline phosphatase family protein [Deltaproteobacteria bacterium]
MNFKDKINSLTIKPELLVIAVLIFVLAVPFQAYAYIGPGAGIAVAGSAFAMFTALLAGIFALVSYPIRYIIRWKRHRHVFARARVKKFVILGLDGMDYRMTKRMLAKGKLPTLEKLSKTGCFKPLATTIPSISPVAWSSFQTGVNPGKHNIFDFLTRDTRTYLPKLSSTDIRGPKKMLKFGKYQFPIGSGDIRLLRKSIPFWKVLGDHGLFSSVLRVPITFPPEKFNGVQLSAMCVPDLRGTQGMFTYYTSKKAEDGEHTGGENVIVKREGNIVNTALVGCPNPFRQDGASMECPFIVTIKDKDNATMKIGKDTYELKTGEYTDWVKVDFKAAPTIKVHGICKFMLISTEPDFGLYVTPINLDPDSPAMPVSHPSVYSTYLARTQGSFATLGLAEDTWALNEKIIDDKAFLQQVLDLDIEREKMWFDSLEKVKSGLCVCVFDGTDRLQHTFWRDIDEKHPAHEKKGSDQPQNVIEDLYIRMDDLVARTMEKCDDDTVFMIISDHGFDTFRYGVDVNKWLEENGYLVLKEDGRGKQHLTGVDWSKTRAFAVGLSGMFLNIKGREAQGIVDPGAEASQLREEIAEKLEQLVDTERENKSAVRKVYIADKVYTGPYKKDAPDLLIGYQIGYRADWDTAIGKVTDKIFHPNTKAWSGDHCIDPALVPGVLFCNRKVEDDKPRLMDIGPTVLEMFGIDTPKYMDAKSLTVADNV